MQPLAIGLNLQFIQLENSLTETCLQFIRVSRAIRIFVLQLRHDINFRAKRFLELPYSAIILFGDADEVAIFHTHRVEAMILDVTGVLQFSKFHETHLFHDDSTAKRIVHE